MSNALSSFGTLLKIGDGATPTEAFTTIAEVKDIEGPGFEMTAVDVTNHSSAGGWTEFVGGILTAGEVSFSINFIPTENTHDYGAGLVKDMVDRTLRNFQVVFPDATTTTWSFAALVTGFNPSAPVDGALTAEVTLKISGQPTLE